MKEGKVTQLCALMLLGYDSRVPAVIDIIELDNSTKEEQVLQLIRTFSRIGDNKLQKYVALESSPKLEKLQDEEQVEKPFIRKQMKIRFPEPEHNSGMIRTFSRISFIYTSLI